ncbi:hypothetical protein [Calothrix sp. PCC 6303]|uniref:hypothetical protein n=1 Tax=Calothrix sp. PCC 6303 TaxID=1170562 RepID=UPI0002A0086A|nr:hypothetical protein [Calothrix sp. PCC 6303]AFZ01113.1 hypothetical protein Cal6303_2087 [Calothrix sp. PCC 6303]
MTLTKNNQSIIPKLTLAALKTGGLAASLLNTDISSASAEIIIQSTGAISGTIQLPSFNPNFNTSTTRIDTDSTGTYYRNIGTKNNPNLVPVYSSKFVQFSNNPDGSIKYYVDFLGIPVVSFDGVLTSPALSDGELSSYSYQGKLDGVKFQGNVQDEFTVGKAYYEGVVTDPKTGQQYKGKFEVNAQGLRYSDAKAGSTDTPTVFDFKSDFMPGKRSEAKPTVTSYKMNNAPLIRVTIKVPDNAEVLSTVSPVNTNTNTNTSSNTTTNTNTGIVNTGIINSGIGGGIVSSGITNDVTVGSNGTLGTTTNSVATNPSSGVTLDQGVTVEPSTFTGGITVGNNGTLDAATNPVATNPGSGVTLDQGVTVEPSTFTGGITVGNNGTLDATTNPVAANPGSGITLDQGVTVEPSTFTGGVTVSDNGTLDANTNPVAANPGSGITLDQGVTVEPSTFTGGVTVSDNGTLGNDNNPVTTNMVNTIALNKAVTVEPNTLKDEREITEKNETSNTNVEANRMGNPEPDLTINSIGALNNNNNISFDSGVTSDAEITPSNKISSDSNSVDQPSPSTGSGIDFNIAAVDPSGTVKNVSFDSNQPKKAVGPRSRILMR